MNETKRTIIILLVLIAAVALIVVFSSSNSESTELSQVDIENQPVRMEADGQNPRGRASEINGENPSDMPMKKSVNDQTQELPQEAIDACLDLSVGDVCSFAGQRGDETGTCVLIPDIDVLSCRPELQKDQLEDK